MVDNIKCPVCGEINSADQEFCQYCQSRLNPLTGPLKGADAPITPGQIPTKKNTAELEPILPQWLRDARDNARKSAEEQAARSTPESEPKEDASSSDLLAGLQSQAGEEEEEIPDWLASITGNKSKSKKAESEPTEVHWVELDRTREFTDEEEKTSPASQTPSEEKGSELPPWMQESQQEQGGVDELTAWLREASSGAEPPAEEAAPSAEAAAGPFDASPPSYEPTPDWLKALQAEEAARAESPRAEEAAPPPPSDEAMPDWLKSLQGQETAGVESSQPEEQGPSISSDADWLKQLQEPQSINPPSTPTETPSWLKEPAPSAPQQEDTPAWLRSSTPAFESGEEAEELPQGDLPDWLKSAAPQSSIFAEDIPAASPTADETPDWLSSLQKEASASTPAFTPETTEETGLPAFTDDSLMGENANALFTEMPDWLSSVASEEKKETPATPTTPPAEALTPGELPSWVQAMRPVEAGVQTGSAVGSDQTLETRGALAGLQGVLPAVPGIGPTSKPKAYSIRLQASEEQQAHAALLEQILAAETSPEPIASFAPLAAQRGLRWFLAALLLLIIGGVTLMRTQFFAAPTGEPNGLTAARLVVEAIPPGAPVLVVIDYEPARVGEMEAVASPLLEAALGRGAVLTFISTSPTGGLLAEHLMTIPLGTGGYVRGTNYLNLGFLPGGLTGVRAFAQNPAAAAPFDLELEPAWSSGPLQGITSLSGFQTMIVVTDNSESARTWIEQTADLRPTTPIVMVSSAQAAPMIQPYYDSLQVSGVVNGLHGGAILPPGNAGSISLAQRYWDAFSLGMLLAMVLIGLGGLWNMALGVRERTAAEAK